MTVTPVLQNVIAGPYTATWGAHTFSGGVGTAGTANTLGIIGSRGIREIRRYEDEEISADLLGNGVVDSVHLGSQMFLEFELEEANWFAVGQLCHPAIRTAVGGTGSAPNKTIATSFEEGEYGIPGTMRSMQNTGTLTLTPAFSTNTPAGAQVTPTRAYGLCMLAPNFELAKLLSSRRRVMPLRIRCLPYIANSLYVFYTKS